MQNISEIFIDKNKDINIIVKTIDSNVYSVNINPEKTILYLKEEISKTVKIPINSQRLIYQGKVLKDNEKIQNYKICNEHVIHLVKQYEQTNTNTDNMNNSNINSSQINNNLENYLGNRENRNSNMENEINNYQNYFNNLLSSLNNINTSNNVDITRLLSNLNSNTPIEQPIIIPDCMYFLNKHW